MIDNINLKTNGKLFPLWIMKNFKEYKLDIPEYKEDPCKNQVFEL
jgi:superfamily II DNA or RNA helicase